MPFSMTVPDKSGNANDSQDAKGLDEAKVAQVRSLLESTVLGKSAEELLAFFAGHEDDLIQHLSLTKTKNTSDGKNAGDLLHADATPSQLEPPAASRNGNLGNPPERNVASPVKSAQDPASPAVTPASAPSVVGDAEVRGDDGDEGYSSDESLAAFLAFLADDANFPRPEITATDDPELAAFLAFDKTPDGTPAPPPPGAAARCQSEGGFHEVVRRASMKHAASLPAAARRRTDATKKTNVRRPTDPTKTNKWAQSFAKLDPRWQIRKFFNDMSAFSNGLSDVTWSINASQSRSSWNSTTATGGAAIFSVWRPTSSDAISKMMTGAGVGKGLEIKGKSAKRGELSGYIPFLQIHEEEHKSKVRNLPKGDRTKIFFRSREARDQVGEHLGAVAKDMTLRSARAKFSLSKVKMFGDAEAVFIEEVSYAQTALACEVEDPKVLRNDDYAPKLYCLEVACRVLWEGLVKRSYISRPPCSRYDTGRASLPPFQVSAHNSKPSHQSGGSTHVGSGLFTGVRRRVLPVLAQASSSNFHETLDKFFFCSIICPFGQPVTAPRMPLHASSFGLDGSNSGAGCTVLTVSM